MFDRRQPKNDLHLMSWSDLSVRKKLLREQCGIRMSLIDLLVVQLKPNFLTILQQQIFASVYTSKHNLNEKHRDHIGGNGKVDKVWHGTHKSSFE